MGSHTCRRIEKEREEMVIIKEDPCDPNKTGCDPETTFCQARGNQGARCFCRKGYTDIEDSDFTKKCEKDFDDDDDDDDDNLPAFLSPTEAPTISEVPEKPEKPEKTDSNQQTQNNQNAFAKAMESCK